MDTSRQDFPHLSDPEWAAYERMVTIFGEASVINMLNTFNPEAQKLTALNFMHQEVVGAQRQTTTPAARVAPLKLDVNHYKGGENEPLLRWFVEMDTALRVRQICDPDRQVAFAMSKLGGRTRSWAFGHRLTNPGCFPDYEAFKYELKLAFEPPKNEFRARAEFLDLRQGRLELHDYTQRARYQVSSIVSDPVDYATQVVTFMKALNDGPVKTQLFREYSETMEEFSLRQARVHQSSARQPRQQYQPRQYYDGPEPMDLSAVPTQANGNTRSRTDVKCFRCDRMGHFARDCRVSVNNRPLSQRSRPTSSGRAFSRPQGRSEQAKNGNDQ